MNFRLAKWIMDRRGSVGIAFIIITLIFAAGTILKTSAAASGRAVPSG